MTIPSQLQRLAAGALLAAGPAFAETPSPAPPPTTEQTAPVANSTESAQSLSEKLNRSNGVIQPKEVDPAIEKPAPKALDPNVVPPPGAPGGSPAPQPK